MVQKNIITKEVVTKEYYITLFLYLRSVPVIDTPDTCKKGPDAPNRDP